MSAGLSGRLRDASLALAALLLALPLALAACAPSGATSGGSSSGGALTPVTLALDWTPNTNHTGIYAALAQGYYRQQGIDLKLTPYSSQVAPEQLVTTGQADFAISFPESVTTLRAQGQPLVSVAAVIQSNTSALISLKSSGLDTVASLAGKRYAGFGAPYEQPVVEQVLKCGGATNPSFQNITTSLDPVEALKSKQFDFAWVYEGWEVIQAQREGLQVNVFPLLDYCMPDYSSPVIVTSQSMIQQHPAVIKRFLAATAEGYTYAIQHPKPAADMLIKGAPKGTFDDTGLVYASQDYLSPLYAAGAKCWGQQTLAKWTDYPRFMFNHQAILDANGNPITTPPDYAAAFTNAFLPPCK
ncbi:MAG TPA: ABC transporter substrate-binding protein [Ktedonobacterales bacterium]|nr:ABC transporter substrate-binding protein [Ktedonobacterales bacterium]